MLARYYNSSSSLIKPCNLQAILFNHLEGPSLVPFTEFSGDFQTAILCSSKTCSQHITTAVSNSSLAVHVTFSPKSPFTTISMNRHLIGKCSKRLQCRMVHLCWTNKNARGHSNLLKLSVRVLLFLSTLWGPLCNSIYKYNVLNNTFVDRVAGRKEKCNLC